MIKRFAVMAVAAVGISVAIPAGAEEIGVGIGPAAWVTVGTSHGDRYRDREVIREREYRDRDRETVVIKKHRDHDRDYDRDRKTVIIDRLILLTDFEPIERPPFAEAVLLFAARVIHERVAVTSETASVMRRRLVGGARGVGLGLLQPFASELRPAASTRRSAAIAR